MRKLLLALLVVSIFGCTSWVVEESLEGIDEIGDEYGYLILHFDSNWRHPNENPFLGRPMDMSLSAKGQLLKDVLLTKPDTRKILRLKPADYTVSFTLIDVNFFFLDEVRVPIKAGEVTNLGTIFVTVPYDDRGRSERRISTISQSGFEELAREVSTDSQVDIGATTHHRFFDISRTFQMRSNLGDRFASYYRVDDDG
ncbi:MAG: hypothetical protein AAGL69_07150 [Pseudomonadota bacterium]